MRSSATSSISTPQVLQDGTHGTGSWREISGGASGRLSPRRSRSICASSNGRVKGVFDSYLSRISSGAEIALNDLSDIDSVASTFSFRKGKELPIDSIRPTNVGFGLSYAASIIIACLIAKPGDLLIIENPEAHLHTKGQRAITDLLGLSAKAGVQIICETHSREVIYHSRKMVDEGVISSKLITFAFVQQNGDQAEVVAWHPITEPIGSFKGQLDGFIDIFGGATDFVR